MHKYFHQKLSLPPPNELVMGLHAVKDLLLYAKERILHVYVSEPQLEGRRSEILEICKKHEIPFSITSNDVLKKMSGSSSHQSIVAHIKQRSFLKAGEFLKRVESKKKSLVLMATHILDPQNFGALIRCTECLGGEAIVWSKNRGAEITPVVSKSSSGASEFLSLIRVSNLAETVSLFQKYDFEAVAALLDEKSENAFSFSFAAKTLLIVGSEGDGIQSLIQKKANRSIHIPMKGRTASLNVAQAATLLISLYQKQFFA